jgi:ribosome-associated protein
VSGGDLRVDGVVIPAAELSWSAVRASGPGGQNVNKVSSKVRLTFDLAGTRALSADQKARLRTLAGRRLDGDGTLTIVSQKTRDQEKNLADAREKLAVLIGAALHPPKPRRPTKPSRAQKRRRLENKRAQSAKKRERRTRD